LLAIKESGEVAAPLKKGRGGRGVIKAKGQDRAK
jgi:hypothetical protein